MSRGIDFLVGTLRVLDTLDGEVAAWRLGWIGRAPTLTRLLRPALAVGVALCLTACVALLEFR
jgi:hypothetical protein